MATSIHVLHHAIFIGILLFFGGCNKQYKSPKIPTPINAETVLDNETTSIEQAQISTKDVDQALNGCPEHMAATALRIKNKSNKPILLEIDHANVGTYDAEDLAITFSKIGLNNPSIKELTVGHDISQGLTIGGIGLLSSAWLLINLDTLKKGQAFTSGTDSMFTITTLATIPLIIIGACIYYAIKSDKEYIIECEQERLIDQFRKMFESTVLAFEDCIEIGPNQLIEQIIFYDTRPGNTQMAQQNELVLQCTSENKKIQIPLVI